MVDEEDRMVVDTQEWHSEDRDVNAAKNILRIGTAGLAGTHACGDTASTVGFTPTASGVVEAGTISEAKGHGC